MPQRKLNAAEVAEWFRQTHLEALARNPEDRLDPVINPGGNAWVNRFVDYAHRLGMQKAFAHLKAESGTLRGRTVLDLGCGRGRWVREYASRGAKVTGVDISPEAVGFLCAELPEHQFLCQDLTRLAIPASSFDIVNSVTVLQHLPEAGQRMVLPLIKASLKPGGYFVLLENVVDSSPIVFAHSLSKWIQLVEATGLLLTWNSGSNYEVIFRIYSRILKALTRQGIQSEEASNAPTAWAGRPSFIKTFISTLRSPMAMASFPLEWGLAKVPLAKPSHAVIIFRN
jgi:SAM-dependent methyltransferase